MGVHPYRISMIGKHQAQNAVVAMTAVELINREYDKHIPEEAIMKGLEATKWPCRLEVLDTSPKIILDGAHNPHGARALANLLMIFSLRAKCQLLSWGCLETRMLMKFLVL